jgi:hypothetical protein
VTRTARTAPIRLAVGILGILATEPARASAPVAATAPRCITSAAGERFQERIAAGAVRAALGSDFAMTGGAIHDGTVHLQVDDADHRRYEILLTLTAADRGPPAARGRNFLYYFGTPPPPADSRAAAALLTLAALFDDAVPDTALSSCGAPPTGYSRLLFVASALVEIVIIAAAIIWGIRAIRSLRLDTTSTCG